MTKKKQIKKCEVVTLTYKIDADFKDPLLAVSTDMFDEVSVEEIPSYYKIHLGVDIHERNHLSAKTDSFKPYARCREQ